MNQRYLYLDATGKLQGPLWLSQMRELYAVGRITRRTEICMQGENEWSHAQSFPEITTTDMEMAVAHGNGPDANRAAYERRMWWWLALLLTLYTVYVVKSW